MDEGQILTFIFGKVIEEIDHGGLKDCDNKNLLDDLRVSCLISEDQHQNIISCETLSDKNR